MSGTIFVIREALVHTRQLVLEKSNNAFPLLGYLLHLLSFLGCLTNRLLLLNDEAAGILVHLLQLISGPFTRCSSLLVLSSSALL